MFKIPISDQIIEYIIVTALEGGSNYWYLIHDDAYQQIKEKTPKKFKGEPLSIKFFRCIIAGQTLAIHDIEDEDSEALGQISKASIRKGLEIAANEYPEALGEFIAGNGDANTADVLFKLFVLGEVVYG